MIDDARAVNASEALEVGLIDAIAEDVPDLLAQLDGLTVVVDDKEMVLDNGRSANAQPFDMNLIEQILHALSNPLLLGILLTIGVQAILIEISSPGGWVAGFIGVVMFGFGFVWFGPASGQLVWPGIGSRCLCFVCAGSESAGAWRVGFGRDGNIVGWFIGAV